jgi:hypothetical protein
VRIYLGTPGFEAAIDPAGRVLAPGVVATEATEHAWTELGYAERSPSRGSLGTLPGSPYSIDPIFARQVLPDAREVRGASVRELAESAYAIVERTIDAWPGPFAVHAITAADVHPEAERDGALGSRVALIERALLDLVKERRRRASRRWRTLAGDGDSFDPHWLLVQLLALSRDHVLVSIAAPRPLPRGGYDLARWPAGRAPVAIDRTLPSRAYQKLEEAWAWMGAAPAPGQLCVDLGAAPGGWTAAALKRGARVLAVDRAPLDIASPRLASVIGNAFTYVPAAPAHWLLCDVVCEPPRSLALIDTWLANRWCRNLVVTVKFKGHAGYGVLSVLDPIFDRAPPSFARVKHLAFNKNEVCVMVKGAP